MHQYRNPAMLRGPKIKPILPQMRPSINAETSAERGGLNKTNTKPPKCILLRIQNIREIELNGV
jgi:hypothetical protein